MNESPKAVGVIGATSQVGRQVLSILAAKGFSVFAFSRQPLCNSDAAVEWRQIPKSLLDNIDESQEIQTIPYWVCAAPIWVLPNYLDWLCAHGAKRVVALSSTSVHSKATSAVPSEVELSTRLYAGESSLRGWAEDNGVEWTILRPTLIYGDGQDKNIAEISQFIKRYRFFPVLGEAGGLRQPIHAEDVAEACVTALVSESASNRAYDISGGETLPYREMVIRVFHLLDRPPRLLHVPLPAFRLAIAIARVLPRYRHLNAAMAMRMNTDLTFSHEAATRDFLFQPRGFELTAKDIPP